MLPPKIDPSQDSDFDGVISYCPVASSFGARILAEGGNAIDAAVETALALAVTYPQAGNIGGGGYMLVALKNGDVHFLDFRETAPRNVREEDFVDGKGGRNARCLTGGLAVGVPGTIAGLSAALERFGTFSWDRLLEPTIELAEHGFWLTSRQAGYLSRFQASLREFESTRRVFETPAGVYRPSALFRQPELGRAFRSLAHNGPKDFYTGTIANLIVDEVSRSGGCLDLADLAEYAVKWRDPVHTRVFGRDLYAANLPSAGGMTLSLCLSILEAAGIKDLPANSPDRYVLLARAFRAAFELRQGLAGDPDFMTPEQILDYEGWVKREWSRADVDLIEERIRKRGPRQAWPGSMSTTHFAVIDREGNAVSCTYSLNTLFGSKLVVGGAGFLLNNSIDDFMIGSGAANWYGVVDGPQNRLEPRRRPVGSMTPTIIRNPGERVVEATLGASGGPMIPTVIAQVIIGYFNDGRSLTEAIGAPRIHHQGIGQELQIEEGVSEEVVDQLKTLGDPTVRTRRLAICAGLIRNPQTKRCSGALDSRFGQYR